ncbi:MAG: hypothetical protein A2Z20_10090 [Bdellovibrionales bacterium RBG_16_40_8]|nr:MAG: hypothetical protein A2Z20_10090 [Bdellovibrionales bacterium RBG_16_40_8]
MLCKASPPREIRGEHEYKANFETLVDKISDLLENGLDDCVSAWGEVNQVQLAKYIKSQKRAGRRKKRAKKDEESHVESATAKKVS